MQRALRLAVIAVLLAGAAMTARADDAVTASATSSRRKTGTRIAYGGLAATLTGVAVGAFAIGLGNDRPDAATPFYAASGVAFGLGAIGLATGFYLRGTSPDDAPDPIAADPIRSRRRTERRVGIALAGAGAAVLITGLAHAVGAYHDNKLAEAQCPNGFCSAGGEHLLARSKTLALAAGLLIGPGAIGLAGGLILYRGARDTGPRLVPVADAHSAGVAFVGGF